MEPRAAIAEYDEAEEHYTFYTTSQNPHVARLVLSAFYNTAPEHKLRVIAPDVGGGFGSKIYIYPEEMMTLWASKKVRRPIKWTGDRSEAFLTDHHGRDHISKAEMAFDKDNKILGLRVKTHANFGAYMSLFSSAVPTYLYATLLSGQYVIPANAGGRLSWRGPARSELSARAHDGDGGAPAEGRSHRVAPQELHHAVPVSDARDHGL
jgi:carbon-monoxide dehydrogenase large subunit